MYTQVLGKKARSQLIFKTSHWVLLFVPAFSPFPLNSGWGWRGRAPNPLSLSFSGFFGGWENFFADSMLHGHPDSTVCNEVYKGVHQLICLLKVRKRPGMGRVNSPGLCFLMVQAFAEVWFLPRPPSCRWLFPFVSSHGLLLTVLTGMML